MSPQNLLEKLKNYRTSWARRAYLQSQLQELEQLLKICQSEMINDQVSMSRAITGMPHGSGTGDPTGRLAMDIASGKVTDFVKQIQDEITHVQEELLKVAPDVHTVELILNALNDRERIVLEMKMIDDRPWAEILTRMNRQYNNSYSKRSLQRLLDRAMEKACGIVK